jgi:hypothetical protein
LAFDKKVLKILRVINGQVSLSLLDIVSVEEDNETTSERHVGATNPAVVAAAL